VFLEFKPGATNQLVVLIKELHSKSVVLVNRTNKLALASSQ
jgi:hypothetical protein